MKISDKISKLRRDPRRGLSISPHRYSGPGNKIDKQYQLDYPPYDRVDAISKTHDIEYHRASLEPDLNKRQKIYQDADNDMIKSLDDLKEKGDLTTSEKIMLPLARFAISAKLWIDKQTYGNLSKNDPTRIIPKKPSISELKGSGVEEYFSDDLDIDDEQTFDKILDYMKANKLISVYWFDSFEFGPVEEYVKLIDKTYDIKKVDDETNLRLFMPDKQYQNVESVLCGHYVLFYAWCFFEKRMNFFEINKFLSENNPADDYIRRWCHIKK